MILSPKSEKLLRIAYNALFVAGFLAGVYKIQAALRVGPLPLWATAPAHPSEKKALNSKDLAHGPKFFDAAICMT